MAMRKTRAASLDHQPGVLKSFGALIASRPMVVPSSVYAASWASLVLLLPRAATLLGLHRLGSGSRTAPGTRSPRGRCRPHPVATSATGGFRCSG